MRKLLTLALSCLLFCLLTTAGFGSLVQSNLGGTATGTLAPTSGTLVATGIFTNSTVSGNLLVMVLYQTSSTGSSLGLTTNPTVGGGYSPSSFSLAGGGFWPVSSSPAGGIVYIFFIANAASMTSFNTITVTGDNHYATSQQQTLEFDLYEFNGIVNPAVIEERYGYDIGTASAPSVPFGYPSSTVNTDLIICAFAGDSTGISAGTGYTLGIDAVSATTGQMEYQLNAAPGQTSASFAGTQANWGAAVVAFETGSSPPPSSAVPRHPGFVN